MSNRKIKTAILALALLLALTAIYLWQAGFLFQKAEKGRPLEKITIGGSHTRLNSLVWIAQNQGFDKEQGLEFTLKTYQAGRDAMRDLISGGLDLACCAEFVLVSEVFTGNVNLRCLSAIASGKIEELIARRDKGIDRPEDLRGKTLGVPRGTIADFFLGRFLTFNLIDLKEVNIVNVNPLEMADALAAGKVDAVVAWKPLTHGIIKKIGNNAVTWPIQGDQDHYWLLVAQEEVVKKKSPALEKLLRALAQAADFVKKKPELAREIMAQWLEVPLTDLEAGRSHMRYELFLDQGLLLAMEDQARWMIRNKLTEQTRLPDFLDYISAAPLAKVDPKAVRLIIPKDERPVAPAPSGTGQVR